MCALVEPSRAGLARSACVEQARAEPAEPHEACAEPREAFAAGPEPFEACTAEPMPCVHDVTVLAVSYPWLSKTHPDPDGWHLRILRHFLRLFFTLENKGLDKEYNVVTRPPSGQGKRVAIFMDWQSLFQEHSPGGRTADQSAAFRRALRSIVRWRASIAGPLASAMLPCSAADPEG